MSVPANIIHHEARKHVVLKERLIAEFPLIDEETLADTLEGLTELNEVLSAIIRSALEDEALAGGLSTLMADLKHRLHRLEERAQRKRQLALQAMDEASLQKLVAPDFTASLKRGAATLAVVSEHDIPAAYWKPQPPKLDRLGLLAALKAGASIDGASLSPPQLQLTVRIK